MTVSSSSGSLIPARGARPATRGPLTLTSRLASAGLPHAALLPGRLRPDARALPGRAHAQGLHQVFEDQRGEEVPAAQEGRQEEGQGGDRRCGGVGRVFQGGPREGRCVHVLHIPCLTISPESRREPRGALGASLTPFRTTSMCLLRPGGWCETRCHATRTATVSVNESCTGLAKMADFSEGAGRSTSRRGSLANQRCSARKAWAVSGWRCMRASRKSLVVSRDAVPLVGPDTLPGTPCAPEEASSLAAAPPSHIHIPLRPSSRPVVLRQFWRAPSAAAPLATHAGHANRLKANGSEPADDLFSHTNAEPTIQIWHGREQACRQHLTGVRSESWRRPGRARLCRPVKMVASPAGPRCSVRAHHQCRGHPCPQPA